MAHLEYLSSVCELTGKSVVDVGAGDGTFAAQLHECGAVVTGIEIDPGKVERAGAGLPDGIVMQVGRAEAMPLADNSMDLACFFFSFHHVPMKVQDQALAEVRRVLRPGGRLHVVEPFPCGSMFDVVRLVEDETEVRTHSHTVFGALGNDDDFRLLARHEYTLTREFRDFASLTDRIVKSDPDRSARFPTVRAEMETTFNRVATHEDGRTVLHQPCAAYHFEVRA